MTSYHILGIFLMVILVISFAGGHFGYTVNGVPKGGEISSDAPGILGALGWVWDSMVFFWDMMSFQVDGLPEFFPAVIIAFMVIMLGFLVIKLIRGQGD